MSTAQTTTNKATFSRFHDAINTGDAEIISKTIDEVVEPNVLFHAPVPTEATGAQALKQVWAVLLRAFPDLHVTVDDVIAEGDKVVARNTVTWLKVACAAAGSPCTMNVMATGISR